MLIVLSSVGHFVAVTVNGVTSSDAQSIAGMMIAMGALTYAQMWWQNDNAVQMYVITSSLFKVRRELKRQTDAKTKFLRYIMHELRVPLNAVVTGINDMMCALLLKRREFGEEEKEDHSSESVLLEAMQHQSLAIQNILDEALDMVRIEQGKFKLQLKPMSIYGLLNGVKMGHEYLARAGGLEFMCDIEAVEGCPVVIGDRPRLRQVMSNLLTNAFKFTREGYVSLAARVESGDMTESGQMEYVLSVKDTGVGIPEEDQILLFEPYVQVISGSARKHGGTGLGLSIAKSVVKMHGGTITVESVPGEGSTFIVRLILRITTEAEAELEESGVGEKVQRMMERVKDGWSPDLDMLLVEDSAVNQMIVGRILKRLGIRFDCADNGRIAVEAVVNAGLNSYDMILMDRQMPEMGGDEATSILRQMGVKTPIVAVTGNAFEDDLAMFMDSGEFEFEFES